MRLGLRYDELDRVESIDREFKFPVSCNLYGQKRQNWETVVWRDLEFPMVENKILHKNVVDYWKGENDVVFPDDSNCTYCFWKSEEQLRENFENERTRSVMYWSAIHEVLNNSTFKKEKSLLDISKIQINPDYIGGGGAEGCRSGWCRG